ncbi:uncharacterized protein LOC143252463 isoform X2 [Tachypleus tridentatus]|uniref:uncharacterized protein LOC143252463 isoform X2 n=1 Tax=Tachypleus tridentatus TaxID=6853 RepID=UPI003FD5FDA7
MFWKQLESFGQLNVSQMDLIHDGLKEYAQNNGWWDSSHGDLNFSQLFGNNYEDGIKRFNCGNNLLFNLLSSGEFSVSSMLTVLCDTESEIYRGIDHKHPTASSQVSVLTPVSSSHPKSVSEGDIEKG